MYRKRGADINLADVLAKIRKEPLQHTPVVYSKPDILAAKKVLNRLLGTIITNEISSITVIPEENEED